jgi:hypothetical protein
MEISVALPGEERDAFFGTVVDDDDDPSWIDDMGLGPLPPPPGEEAAGPSNAGGEVIFEEIIEEIALRSERRLNFIGTNLTFGQKERYAHSTRPSSTPN